MIFMTVTMNCIIFWDQNIVKFLHSVTSQEVVLINRNITRLNGTVVSKIKARGEQNREITKDTFKMNTVKHILDCTQVTCPTHMPVDLISHRKYQSQGLLWATEQVTCSKVVP
jgi:hypothetical protein